MFKMWTIESVSVLLFLGICTAIDLKKKSLPVWLLWAGSLGIFLISLWNSGFHLLFLLKGMVPGIFLAIISRVTREAIGYGDVWLVFLLGMYLGIWETVTLVCIAFFLCSIVAAGCLIWKNFRRDMGIPFVPFLAAAYVGVIFL